MKIEKLTKEQEALLPVVRDEWVKFCLGGDTEINRKVAADGIRWIYGLAKLDSPFVIFVDGPMACQYAVLFIKAMMKDKKLTDQVGAQVGDQVGAQVGDQVMAQVGAQVRVCAYKAVADFFGLEYDHPAFELVRMGIIVAKVLKKFKVFGKSGKYLGEF